MHYFIFVRVYATLAILFSPRTPVAFLFLPHALLRLPHPTLAYPTHLPTHLIPLRLAHRLTPPPHTVGLLTLEC
jgi:hypothetical protein